jgi:hypothetical protein
MGFYEDVSPLTAQLGKKNGMQEQEHSVAAHNHEGLLVFVFTHKHPKLYATSGSGC